MHISIVPLTRQSIERGDFQAEVIGNSLGVPSDLFMILQRIGLDNADALVRYAQCSSPDFAKFLGWNLQEVYSAQMKLQEVLDQYFPNRRSE